MHKHKYHFFSNIENTNKNIDAKVKYFFDCMAVSASLNNLHYNFKCENHRSLVNSIIYQIEHGEKKYMKKYIDRYLKNCYFKDCDSVIFSMGISFDVIKEINAIINNENTVIEFSNYLSRLKQLSLTLNKDYFRICFDKIYNHICDGEPLSKHIIDCIFYYTKLLVSEFYLAGATKVDSHKIIDMLLKKSKSKGDKNSDFEHLNLSSTNFESELSNYYNTKSFKQSFDEIILMYENLRKPQDFIYLIKSDLKIDVDIDVEILNVKFTSKRPLNIPKKYNVKINSKRLFAICKVNLNGEKSEEIAKQKVRKSSLILEKMIKSNLIVENFSIQIGKHCLVNHPFANINNNEELKNLIAHNCLATENKDSTKQYLINLVIKNDEYFIRGYFCNSPDETILYLWNYIEAFHVSKEDTVSKVCNILHDRFPPFYIEKLYDLLKHEYFHFMSIPPFVKETDNPFYKALSTDPNKEYLEKICWFKKRFNHPAIKLVTRNIEDPIKEAEYFKNFIKSCLEEVYEQRNMIVHSCKYNSENVLSIIDIFKVIVSEFRRVKISEINCIKLTTPTV